MYLSKYFNAENICDDFFSFLIYVRVDKRNVVIASHAVAYGCCEVNFSGCPVCQQNT